MAGAGNTYTYVGLQQFGSRHVAVYQEKGSTGQTFDYTGS